VGRVVEASERRHMRLVLSIHVALSISCDRQDYQPGQRKSDDARRDVLVLAAALARPYPNMCWHRLLPWLLNRLLPRAAVKQTDAETIFKILNLRADRTGRNPKLPRRGCETARLCDLHEGGYAGHAIHEITPAARCLHASALITAASAASSSQFPRASSPKL